MTVIAPPNNSREDMTVVRMFRGGGRGGGGRCSTGAVGMRTLTLDRDARDSRLLEPQPPPRGPLGHPLLATFGASTLARMTDYRRRVSNMPQAMDPYGSRSGLPVPSTIKKPSHNTGRMSMSGPALRAPYPMAPPAGPGPTPRQSMMRSTNMNPLLMSTTKANAFGRTPVHG